MKDVLKSKILKNSVWLLILQFVNTIVPMVTIPYVTRQLGTEMYGVFSACLNWIIYLQVLVEFGFGLTGARKTAIIESQQELNKLFNNIISSRIVLLLFSFLIYLLISIIFHFSLQENICFLILFIIILGTTFQLTWLFQGKQDMKFITLINCFSRFISTILIFVFIKNKNMLYWYAFFYSFTILLSSIISMIAARKKYDLSFKFAGVNSIKNEIMDAKDLFYSSAMSKIFSSFGVTVLDFVSSKTIVGIYSAIYKIPYVLTMIFSPISQAIFPYISIKMKDDYNKGVIFLKRIFIPIIILFSLIGLLIIAFRNEMVLILFGKEYSKYSIIIIPLIVQLILAIINNFLGVQFLVATNNKKLYSNAFLKAVVIIVIANVLLGYFFDIIGVAVATAVGELFLTLFLLRNVIKVGNEMRLNND